MSLMAKSKPRKAKNGFLACCGALFFQDERLPLVCFDQDEELIFYRVEFAIEKMDINGWSMGITEKRYLHVRVVVKPPEIWIAHIKLRDNLEDDEITVDYENHFRKVTIILQKPDLYSWNTMGTYMPDHNSIIHSAGASPDYYLTTILFKEEIDSSHYLLALYTGAEYNFGVPPGWAMMLKVNGMEEKYYPVRFLTFQQKQEHSHLDKHKNVGEVTFFIIAIYEEDTFTSALHSLPLHKNGALHIGGVHGTFDTDWLLHTDRLIMVSGGAGMCPFTTIIRFLHDHETRLNVRQVIFIYSFRASKFQQVMWHEAWETLATFDWFFYIPYITTGKTNDGSRITAESLKGDLEQVPPPKSHLPNQEAKVRVMISGSQALINSCLEIGDIPYRYNSIFALMFGIYFKNGNKSIAPKLTPKILL